MSYIYGAPSKARNANVVYIWTYIWQRWNSLFLFFPKFVDTFLCWFTWDKSFNLYKAAFLKLWSADHKWSSVSALLVLLDWILVPKKNRKNKINMNCLSHTIVENLKQSLEITYNKRLCFLSQDWHFMKFTTLPTLLSATKEGFSVAKTCFEHCLGQA